MSIHNSDKEKLSDWLALERTKMANQRTLLAMLRTGFYFLVMGLTVLTVEQLGDLRNYYWMFFIVGGVFIIIGIIHYFYNRNKLTKKYESSLSNEK
jgi:putative membrane protein